MSSVGCVDKHAEAFESSTCFLCIVSANAADLKQLQEEIIDPDIIPRIIKSFSLQAGEVLYIFFPVCYTFQ
jgi:hypothetical protein